VKLDLQQKQAATIRALGDFEAEADRTFSPDAFLLWIQEFRPELMAAVGSEYLLSFARGYVRCPPVEADPNPEV
jgi:hypothetical protein